MSDNQNAATLSQEERDRRVDRFVEELLQLKLDPKGLQRYTGGPLEKHYRREFGHPDYLYVDETSMRYNRWLSENCTPEMQPHIGGRLVGIDPGCYFKRGCRKEFDIPDLGKVTVDFWCLRWYLDES